MNAKKTVIASILALAFMPAFATESLTCSSTGNSHTHCDLSNAHQRDIRITNEKSGDCSINNAWGVDSSGIWVDKGCSAVFEYTAVASSNNISNNNGGANVVIAPGFIEPYYGPGYYYGAGYYEHHGWDHYDYDHRYEHNQDYRQHHDHYEHHDGGYHGGGHHGGGRK